MEMQNPQPVSRQDRGLLLIVDDDAINCAILENIFAPYYGIAQAENGRVGLERVMELEDELCAIFSGEGGKGLSSVDAACLFNISHTSSLVRAFYRMELCHGVMPERPG